MAGLWQRAMWIPTPPGYWRMLARAADGIAVALIAAFVLDGALARPGRALVTVGLLIAAAAVVRLAMAPRQEASADEGLVALVATAAIGLMLIPTLAFSWHLLGGPVVSVDTLIGAAAVLGLGAGLLSMRRPSDRGVLIRLFPLELLGPALLRRSGTLTLAACVTGVWFLRHDGSLPPVTCMGEGAWIAIGHNPQGIDLLRDNVGDSRLGNVGLLSGSLALFEGQAFRLLYAVCGGIMALTGYLIGLRCAGNRRWATFAALLLPLNPYTLSIPLIDENLLAATTASVVLALALQTRPAWGLVGAFAGLLFSMRHPFAVALPALFVLAWLQRHRWRDVLALAAGAGLLSALAHTHHLLAFGSLARFESTAQFPPQSYDLLGWTWRWQGMLNWPLHDNLVRTPHNPWPMLVAWMPHLADHFGLLLFGALLLGVGAAVRRDRRLGWFWLAWSVPIMAGLAVQESWDYPNKMGVAVIGTPVAVAWIVTGGQRIAAGGWRPRLVWLGLVAACWLAIAGLRGWQVPADGRYFRLHDLAPHESASHLAELRRQGTDVGLLPDVGRIARHGAIWTPWKWRALRSLDAPGAWGWHPAEAPTPGAGQTFELDLRTAIWRRTDLLQPSRAPPDIDLMTAAGQVVATAIDVPWEPRPLTVTAVRGPKLTLIEIALQPPRADSQACDPRKEPCRCQFFDSLERGASDVACGHSRLMRHGRPTLRIRAPLGGVSLAVTINPVGNVVWLWRGVMGSGAVTLAGPVHFWHN